MKHLLKIILKIFSGGTDTHLMLLLKTQQVTGKDAEESLGRANIICNKTEYLDTESPMITSA